MTNEYIPGLGLIPNDAGMYGIEKTSDGRFRAGEHGVRFIISTGDRKVEFVSFNTHTLAYVKSAMGYPAYYPVHDVKLEKPIRGLLLDLDGTIIRSENFWIWIIEKTIASLLEDPDFRLKKDDIIHVSGQSVSEHLQYCITEYCPEKTLEDARKWYFKHTQYETSEIIKGRGVKEAFKPSPGIKDFLLALREMGVKIGLVTSGLYEKAWPEIIFAAHSLKIEKPQDFFHVIITAGFPLRNGAPGTLAELPAKPHPWLYAEAARIGFGFPFEERHHVVGIEDSGVGICSIRLAGFSAIGISGGNIVDSGTKALCTNYCESFEDILFVIRRYVI